MDIRKIKKLIELLEESDVEELEIHEKVSKKDYEKCQKNLRQ